MAKSATGKWVSRVGSSGGGKAYRKSRPNNFYGILIVIVVLGVAATLLARYDYQHPGTKAAGAAPRVGTTWYAALAVENCGTALPYLATDSTLAGGLTVETDNVLRVAPISAADSGNNATVSQFAAEYPGMIASSTELAIPNAKDLSNPKTTFHNGDTCAAGTKYAGQKGTISYAYWSTFGQKKPVVTTNPGSIKFAPELRVTMAFDPAGVTPAPPTQATDNEMVLEASTPTTTTTTPASTAPTTTTTVATTTTSPKTTTTTKG